MVNDFRKNFQNIHTFSYAENLNYDKPITTASSLYN